MAITPGAGMHPDLIDEVPDITFPPGPGIHPDLADSGGAESEASTARGAGEVSLDVPPAEQSNDGAPETEPDAEASTSGEAEGEPAEVATQQTPDWWDELRSATDANTALAVLTAHLTPDDLVKDNRIAGIIGQKAYDRVQQEIQRREANQRETLKAQAAQNGDLYTLGELSAPEVLAQLRQQATQEAEQKSLAPLTEAVAAFQDTLPEAVRAEVAGRHYAGATVQEGIMAYMDAVVKAAIKHHLEPEVEREIKRREPVLRKQFLASAYGEDMSPELAGGTPKSVHEITDEQVAGMSLEEYDQYFDDYGRPKDGVRLRMTRAEPVKRQ